MDRLGLRCPWPGYPRPSVLLCLLILTASFLTYPMLRTLSQQLLSVVTGSYVSGTYSIVFVNCPNEQIARDIARAILDKKLTASVNILPKAYSLYYWNGEIEEATEILLLIKTKTSKVRMLSSYIRTLQCLIQQKSSRGSLLLCDRWDQGPRPYVFSVWKVKRTGILCQD
ncbi:protein CutA homolog isoform X1 [Pseudorca crassidens]|uniref:protein CutA homolog isoform X1 n=1 Tax=Pseudorca crassidens TaxID=82174 RepID=UPI00352CEA47